MKASPIPTLALFPANLASNLPAPGVDWTLSWSPVSLRPIELSPLLQWQSPSDNVDVIIIIISHGTPFLEKEMKMRYIKKRGGGGEGGEKIPRTWEGRYIQNQ